MVPVTVVDRERGWEMALEWITAGLRVSLFAQENFSDSQAIWKTLTGSDEFETQRNVPGRRQISGPFQSGVLNVAATATRLDCVMQPSPPSGEGEIDADYIPSLGPWPDSIKNFVGATSNWLSSVNNPILRLALGGAVVTRCNDLHDAYGVLSSQLRNVKVDPDRTRDLIYRVNYPVESSVTGEKLNRVTTWAAMQLSLQVVHDFGSSSVSSESTGATVVRLEFDCSTDADRSQPFDPSKLVPIYDELVALASENVERGEVC